MSDLSKWEGIPYQLGENDCFSLIRNYLLETYGVWTPNVARPTDFWEDPNLDLYGLYKQSEFVQIFDVPLEEGDVLLMPYGTSVNTHAAIIVEGNQILHALPGQLSRLDPLHPRWSRRANIILRHPKVFQQKQETPVHVHEVIHAGIFRDPRFEAAAARALEQRRREMRDRDPGAGNQGDGEPGDRPSGDVSDP
tara:strand:+ start:707 stop:1288 length:582 start_codon:yes stop_codon:yes gene_type:complete